MKDYIELGSAPWAEDCVQVGSENYWQRMHEECLRYKKMLQNRFPELSGRFFIKTFPHDFGSYKVVCFSFDDRDQLATTQAFFVEAHLPERWADGEVFTGLNELKTDEGEEI